MKSFIIAVFIFNKILVSLSQDLPYCSDTSTDLLHLKILDIINRERASRGSQSRINALTLVSEVSELASRQLEDDNFNANNCEHHGYGWTVPITCCKPIDAADNCPTEVILKLFELHEADVLMGSATQSPALTEQNVEAELPSLLSETDYKFILEDISSQHTYIGIATNGERFSIATIPRSDQPYTHCFVNPTTDPTTSSSSTSSSTDIPSTAFTDSTHTTTSSSSKHTPSTSTTTTVRTSTTTTVRTSTTTTVRTSTTTNLMFPVNPNTFCNSESTTLMHLQILIAINAERSLRGSANHKNLLTLVSEASHVASLKISDNNFLQTCPEFREYSWSQPIMCCPVTPKAKGCVSDVMQNIHDMTEPDTYIGVGETALTEYNVDTQLPALLKKEDFNFLLGNVDNSDLVEPPNFNRIGIATNGDYLSIIAIPSISFNSYEACSSRKEDIHLSFAPPIKTPRLVLLVAIAAYFSN